MVEISMSGSGEGPGRAISRGYSTTSQFSAGGLAWAWYRGLQAELGVPSGVCAGLRAASQAGWGRVEGGAELGSGRASGGGGRAFPWTQPASELGGGLGAWLPGEGGVGRGASWGEGQRLGG